MLFRRVQFGLGLLSATAACGGSATGGQAAGAGAGTAGVSAVIVGAAGVSAAGGSVGSSGSVGSGGSGGALFGGAGMSSGGGGGGGIVPVTISSATKIDLLFMIDNSVSMADKQEVLQAAVPVLVGRLVSPICVDEKGAPTGGSSPCAAPSQPELEPVTDIHIGIVSSSLGAHGGTVCSTGAATDTLNDKGELIGSMRPTGSNPDATLTFDASKTWNNSGFLAWDPSGTANVPPGETSAAAFATNFAAMIHAVGEHGCGYEASLEAWYRFLIDPEPPATVDKVGGATVRSSSGKPPSLDMNILAQRKAFLRPDSLVAIVMLTDENDCSIRDDSVGWFVGSSSHMPRATAACATNPNDACCRSCAQNEAAPPAGCPALSADPVCMTVAAGQPYVTWDGANDSLNLRCYNQHQRFGFDLLYETSRYVNALTKPVLTLQSDGKTQVPNPLFDNGMNIPPRDPSLVFLVGIIGVPWQDIADAASLTGPALHYLTATELVAQGRWAQLLGDPTAGPPVPPSDPFMIETPGTGPYPARTGMNPNTLAAIAPAASMNPTASPINGHEQNIPALDDLQYACTFKLTTPKVCAPGDAACDCSPDKMLNASAVVAANSPLCQPPGGGAASTTQYFAKAYPGVRELQVLKDFGANAIVASICPKVTASANPASDPNYGYNPAVTAVIERLKQALQVK